MRRSWDRLIFNMGIPILVRHLYIEISPRTRAVCIMFEMYISEPPECDYYVNILWGLDKMACARPSHYLNQWWSIYLIGHIRANLSLDVVCKMASILFGSEPVYFHFRQTARHRGSYIIILPPVYIYCLSTQVSIFRNLCSCLGNNYCASC